MLSDLTSERLPMAVLQEQPWLAQRAAQTAYTRGQFDEARTYADMAAAGFDRAQDQKGQVMAASLRSSLALIAGDRSAARGFLEGGCAALAPGMDVLRAQLLEQRWLLCRADQPEDHDTQEQLLHEALLLYRHAPERRTEDEARVLDRLGVVALERGHLQQAIERSQRSVELFSQTGSPPWETAFNLAVALSAACRFADALAAFVPMSQRSERPMRRLIGALNLLDIYITLDNPTQADVAARTALELAGALKTPHLAARARVELARLYRQQGEYDLAVTEARAAAEQAVRGGDRQSERDARLALAEAGLWTRPSAAGAPDWRDLAPGSMEAARTQALAGVYLLRSRTRAAREEGAALLRQALRDLTQQSAFRGFVLRHRDLALTFAVAGLAAGVLPSACQAALSALGEVPESVRARGIRLPDPEARLLQKAAAAQGERGSALLEPLLPPDQRRQMEEEAVSLLRVRILGHFGLRVNGKPLAGKELGWRRAQPLMLTLLLHPEGIERELLAEWLWPDAGRSAAQNQLRVSLHHLRHLLEPDRSTEVPPAFVRSDGGRLIWRAETTRTDLWDLQERLRTADLLLRQGDLAVAARTYEQATALYRGPLVTDGCAWLEGHRERLHRELVQAFWWLVGYYRREQPERAINALQQLLDVEPEDEQAVRELMLLLAAAGRRAEAARVYRRCCEYLERELGVEADPATTAVYVEISGIV